MSPATIPDLFFDRIRQHPDRMAHASKPRDGDEDWVKQTWAEYGDCVRAVAASLLAAGIAPGDRVAILASNRPEWLHVDMAAMTVGAVPLGIYTTSSPEQIEYLLTHSGARLLVLENESDFEKVAPRLKNLDALGSVVMMSGVEPRSPAVSSWDEFVDSGKAVPEREIDERRNKVVPEDLGSLVYTSGTTGPPKAVMLTHRNLVESARMGIQAIKENLPDDRAVSYLPLAHMAEKGISVLGPVAAGYAIYFCADLEHLPRYIREVRPTVFVGVPRLWEKMHDTIVGRLAEPRDLGSRLAGWALNPGDADPPRGVRKWVTKAVVRPSLLKKMGLDQAHTTITGSAPIAPHIVEFFLRVGLEIRDIYGLSECSGPATFTRPGKVRPGWIGQPFDGAEVRIAADGEILIRGPHVFPGYLDDPAATEATLSDGWLRSGDLGEIDEEGTLRITGRKKEMIITAGGKNIAPRHIESLLSGHEAVRDVMVVGDGRKYLTALFTLAEDRNGPDAPLLLERHVDAVNEQLARAEQIKRFSILPAPFAETTGELTPTRKLRRSYVCQKYAVVIDRLYDDTGSSHTGLVSDERELDG